MDYSTSEFNDIDGLLSVIDSNDKSINLYKKLIMYQIYHDYLTDTPNRLALIKELAQGLNSAVIEPDYKVAIILIDIDDFKRVNDTYGYKTGDKILVSISERIKEAIGVCGNLYRIGSDEFAIILYDYKKQVRLKRKVEEILDKFSEAAEIDGKKIFITLSTGIALFPEDGYNSNELIKNADIAMSVSKNYGKTKCNYYCKGMEDEVAESVNMESALIEAVIDNQFILYYQPQVDVNTHKVYGLDALLRWKHPKLGIIKPSYYIDIIEKNGMICKVGNYVLVEVCREILRLNKKGLNNLIFSINVSAKQLDNQLFFAFYERTLDSMKVGGKNIIIEITERTLLNASETVLNNLIAIRNKGTKIYIGDFGAKYAALNCLKSSPVDGIKIDRSFIKDTASGSKNIIILKNIVRLAKELNINVIIEGVEAIEQVEYLKKIGCNIMQGFIFFRPMPSNKIINTIQGYV